MKTLFCFLLSAFCFSSPAAAPLTINVGSAPNDNTGDSLRTAFGKVNTNFANLFFPVYCQTNGDKLVSGTNAAISLVSSGPGSLVIAPFTNSNLALRLFATGQISTAPVASNLTFSINLGGVAMGGVIVALSNQMSGAYWQLEAKLYTANIDAAGTTHNVYCWATATMNGTNSGPYGVYMLQQQNSFVSTTNNTFDLTAQFNIGVSSNSIFCRQLILEKAGFP